MRSSGYSRVWSTRASSTLWLGWLAVALTISAPAVQAQLNRFATNFPSAGPVILLLLAGLAVPLPILYRIIRRRGLWVYEPLIILGLLLVLPLFYAPAGTLPVVWMLIVAYAIGRFCRERLGCLVESPVADLVFSSALGFLILMLVLALLGLAGGYSKWAFALLLAVPTVLFRKQCAGLLTTVREIQQRWRGQGDDEAGSLMASLGFVISLCLVACAFLVVLTPSIWPDPLEHHLPLIRYYAESGGLVPMPSDAYTYHPQSFEVLSALAWSLGKQSAVQLVHPVFLLLALLATYGVGRELGIGRTGAMVGTAFVAAVPAIHWTGVNIKNDLAVALFHLVSLWCFLRWLSDRNFRWIYLGVSFAAAAWLFKHPGAMAVPGLGLLFIYAAWQQPRRLRAFAACALLFVSLSSIWMVRAYISVGDPFYPTHPADPYHRRGDDDTWWEDHRDKFLRPWTVHFGRRSPFARDEDRALGLALMATVPLWLIIRRRTRKDAGLAVAIYVAAHLLIWNVYAGVPRFAFAPLALLMMLAMSRLEYWYRIAGRLTRSSLFLTAGAVFSFAMTIILVNEINIGQVNLLSGKIDRGTYLRSALYGYESLEALRREAKETDNVIALGVFARGYAPYPQRYYFRGLNRGSFPQKSVATIRPRYMIAPATPEYDLRVRKSAPTASLIHSTRDARLYGIPHD